MKISKFVSIEESSKLFAHYGDTNAFITAFRWTAIQNAIGELYEALVECDKECPLKLTSKEQAYADEIVRRTKAAEPNTTK